MKLDIERSLDIAYQVPTIPKECWANAVRALRTRSLRLHDAKYVEGWVVTYHHNCGLVMEHGWIELSDETILDPTFAWLGERYDGFEVYERSVYFPGIRFTLQELKGIRFTQLPMVRVKSQFWGHDIPAYRQAYIDAYQHIGIDWQAMIDKSRLLGIE